MLNGLRLVLEREPRGLHNARPPSAFDFLADGEQRCIQSGTRSFKEIMRVIRKPNIDLTLMTGSNDVRGDRQIRRHADAAGDVVESANR